MSPSVQVDATNEDVYEMVGLKGSAFNKDVLHVKKSHEELNVWGVIERYPIASFGGAKKFDVYCYAGFGQNFAMINAEIEILVATYNAGESQDDIEA